MNFTRLQPFIVESAKSSDIKVKKAAESLTEQMMSAQQAEEIAQPTLHAQSQNKPLNDKPKDEVDHTIDTWMPDVVKPEDNESSFGKGEEQQKQACSLFHKYSSIFKEKQSHSLFNKIAKKLR